MNRFLSRREKAARSLLGLALTSLVLLACSSGMAPTLAPVSENAGGDVALDEPAATPQPQSTDENELIVYRGTLDIEVAELRPAMDQAEQLVRGFGGHVAASRVQDSSIGQSASVTYRIPAERWSEALAGLRGLGSRVVTETTQSENVTAQAVDLDARLSNLSTTESALQSIMDKATTVDDVLKVQRELTDVRSEIERLTAQRNLLANQAALATLEVTYEVPVPESSRASEGWDLGHEVDAALAALVRLGQMLVSALVWLIVVVLPLVVPLAIAVYVAVRLRRRWLANRPMTPASAAGSGAPPPGPWMGDV